MFPFGTVVVGWHANRRYYPKISFSGANEIVVELLSIATITDKFVCNMLGRNNHVSFCVASDYMRRFV